MRKRVVMIVAVMIMVWGFCTVTAFAVSTRAIDVSQPAAGNAIVGVVGSYEYTAKTTILAKINKIRKEAYDKGYPNPETGAPLTPSEYVPLKWSSDLEIIAQWRAAEATVDQDHTRPNGGMCVDCKVNGTSSYGENLAWNGSGILEGIDQWYEEKNDWVNQNSGAVTGHYESLILPSFQYIGLGAFKPASGGWTAVAAEFGFVGAADEPQNKLSGTVIQRIEVEKSRILSNKLSVSKLVAGTSKQLSGMVQGKGFYGMQTLPIRFTDGVTWKSSAPSVASVSAGGMLSAKKPGKVTITATVYGKKVSASVLVKPAKAVITKVKPGKKKLVVKFKKQPGVTGYQIAYKKGSGKWKYKTVKGASKTSKTIKKLVSKKKYSVKMRAYKTVDGTKVFGAWSKVKKVKVK